MKHITFKQFINTFNFRYVQDIGADCHLDGTQIVRIYLPLTDNYLNRDWFEFGIYDFASKKNVLKQIERIFNKKLIDSYVESFNYHEEMETFEVYLTDKKVSCD